jgi:hypothetical protein
LADITRKKEEEKKKKGKGRRRRKRINTIKSKLMS